MIVKSVPSGPNVITVTLDAAEASKLRRVCYYNKTVGQKYAGNPVGGSWKGSIITEFLGDLGSALKAANVERF
jgi:hypothetical protein